MRSRERSFGWRKRRRINPLVPKQANGRPLAEKACDTTTSPLLDGTGPETPAGSREYGNLPRLLGCGITESGPANP